MSDPFDINTTGQSDSSGVSPDFFQNLMNFGLATMSASSTPGITLAGALGRGGQAAMENAKNTQQLRMENQLHQQQLVGSQLGNAQQYNQMQMQNAMRQQYGLSTLNLPNIPGLSIQQPSQSSSLQNQPQQTAQQFRDANGMQTPPIQIARQQNGTTAPEDVGLGSAAPDPVSPGATSSSGPVWSDAAGYSTPAKTSEYPSDGMIPNNQIGSYLMNPTKLANVSPNQARQLAAAATQLGYPIPKELSAYGYAGLTAEAEATARARHPGTIEARPGGMSYAPDAGITVTGRVEGETPSGVAYVTPPHVSGPGSTDQAITPPPNPSSLANPQIPAGTSAPIANAALSASQSAIPRTASFLPPQAQNVPAQENSPSNLGLPPGSVLTNIGPGAAEQIKNEMEFHTNGEHGELKSYNAAIGSQQNLTQLQSYLDTLNAHQTDANFLASGSGSELRTDIAKAGNTAWAMAGNDPKTAPFDPDKLSAAQASYKTANLLGMQLINSQFGASREAASIIQTGMKSVPSMENTPQGAQLLLNGAKEVSNNTIDRYTFKEWWAGENGPHPGDLRGADVAFNQQFPPKLYAKRAISQENPIDISGLKQPPNLLPGTIIKYGNAPPKIWKPKINYKFELPSINGEQ